MSKIVLSSYCQYFLRIVQIQNVSDTQYQPKIGNSNLVSQRIRSRHNGEVCLHEEYESRKYLHLLCKTGNPEPPATSMMRCSGGIPGILAQSY